MRGSFQLFQSTGNASSCAAGYLGREEELGRREGRAKRSADESLHALRTRLVVRSQGVRSEASGAKRKGDVRRLASRRANTARASPRLSRLGPRVHRLSQSPACREGSPTHSTKTSGRSTMARERRRPPSRARASPRCAGPKSLKENNALRTSQHDPSPPFTSSPRPFSASRGLLGRTTGGGAAGGRHGEGWGVSASPTTQTGRQLERGVITREKRSRRTSPMVVSTTTP